MTQIFIILSRSFFISVIFTFHPEIEEVGSREVKLKVSGGYIFILSKLGTDENI